MGAKWLSLFLGFGCYLLRYVLAESCDPRLPHCRNRQPGDGNRRDECKPFWLIPGRSQDCTRPSSSPLIKIDADSVTISPSPIKLPGCFTISMKVDLLATSDSSRNFLSKIEYDWWSFPQFATLPCQNTSSDGCGGYGNNCYYCDICSSLHELNGNKNVKGGSIAQQFREVECPKQPGTYQLQRQFCFNDFRDFDKNNDCEPDFMENSNNGESYKEAIKNVEKMGFGTVTAKFTLAHNATKEQRSRKLSKETELEQTVDAELAQKRQENSWAMDNEQYMSFRHWYVQNRKDRWHKQEYLPWLLYNNEVGCLTVNFQVCNKEPTAMARGSSTMNCL